MARSIMVLWKEGDAAGFTDILPLEWFSANGTFESKTHIVEGKHRGRNWRGRARSDLVVHGLTADLNYMNHQKFNGEHGMHIGTMRICFDGRERAVAKEVLWKDEETEDFERQSVDITIGEPPASDIALPPKRIKAVAFRVLRDTITSQEVKQLHGGKCQICGTGIALPDGTNYAEAHHIKPLGMKHKGPDVRQNIICVCPNHHVELDYGLRELRLADLERNPAHEIDKQYIDYHNERIFIR
jgi:predicted restriction endonuclease